MKDWKETKWTLENGVTFDINEVLHRCHNVPIIDLPIEVATGIRTVEIIDRERVDNASLLYPILVVEDETGRYILDGNHRLQKQLTKNKPRSKQRS